MSNSPRYTQNKADQISVQSQITKDFVSIKPRLIKFFQQFTAEKLWRLDVSMAIDQHVKS